MALSLLMMIRVISLTHKISKAGPFSYANKTFPPHDVEKQNTAITSFSISPISLGGYLQHAKSWRIWNGTRSFVGVFIFINKCFPINDDMENYTSKGKGGRNVKQNLAFFLF